MTVIVSDVQVGDVIDIAHLGKRTVDSVEHGPRNTVLWLRGEVLKWRFDNTYVVELVERKKQ